MKKYFVVLAAMFLLAIVACSSGGDSDGSDKNSDPAIVSEQIGAAGGTIEVTNSESEMFRTKIVIPTGALNTDTVISVKIIEPSSVLPDYITNGGVFIDFGPDGTVFNSNISVTIPYDDKNNDGIVDDTDISENELSVMYLDSHSLQWTNIYKIINRDTINNTITFETNHFTQYTTYGFESTSDIKVSIFAIDGLDFDRTYKGLLFNADINYPARVEYLCSGILEANILNIKEDACYSFRGINPDESWSGDATQTFDYLEDLVGLLTEKSQQAKQQGKKFIVVTHSWGTQLGVLGLSLSGVEPDLFITLSDPEGSIYVDDTSYSDDWFKLIPPISVSGAETLIWELTRIYGIGALSPINIKTKKWINYWDVGDIISGPLKSIYKSNSIDDRTVIDCTNRNYETTKKVHAITSLKDDFWTTENGVSNEDGKAFRNRVIFDILQAM